MPALSPAPSPAAPRADSLRESLLDKQADKQGLGAGAARKRFVYGLRELPEEKEYCRAEFIVRGYFCPPNWRLGLAFGLGSLHNQTLCAPSRHRSPLRRAAASDWAVLLAPLLQAPLQAPPLPTSHLLACFPAAAPLPTGTHGP